MCSKSEVVDCLECGSPFKRTPHQKARGRVFCTWKCYLADREKRNSRKRDAKQSQPCSNDSCSNVGIVSRGLCNACYQRWCREFGPSAKPFIEKQCPVCGHVFPTNTDRKFCSLDCYVKSDVFRKARQEFSEKVAASRVSMLCMQCNEAISVIPSMHKAGRLFCCRACYRQYFADRFDRAIASNQTLLSPSSYDEFLCQEELPCLVDGCDWYGRNLSIHVNHVHGITAADLKAMAGFNRGTGVVTSATSALFSSANRARGSGRSDFYQISAAALDPSRKRGPMRPEGKEHHRKAGVIR